MYFSIQAWAGSVMFMLGCFTYSGVAVVGLCAMDVVDARLVGSAHGLACAVAQGMFPSMPESHGNHMIGGCVSLAVLWHAMDVTVATWQICIVT